MLLRLSLLKRKVYFFKRHILIRQEAMNRSKNKVRAKTEKVDEAIDWILAVDICPQTLNQMRS